MKLKVIATAIFPRSKLRAPEVFALRVEQREYHHDVVVITLHKAVPHADQWAARAPVTVTYGYSPGRTTQFTGYVNHVEGIVTADGVTRTEIVCIGASYVMKKTRQKKWQGKPSAIAASIINSYKFNPRLKPVNEANTSLLQAHESDFLFLCNLAKKVGYTCFASNTEIHFYPRSTKLDAKKKSALVFKHQTSPGESSGKILSFHPILGETVGDGKAVHIGQGVSTQGTTVLLTNSHNFSSLTGTHATAPQFFKFHTDIVGKNSAEAAMFLRGKSEAGRYHLKAHVTLDGDARISQVDPVILRGLGDDNDGYWIVLEVEHKINYDGSYIMEAVLGRDSIGNAAGAGSSGTGDTITTVSGDESDSPEPPLDLYNLDPLAGDDTFSWPVPDTVADEQDSWVSPFLDPGNSYAAGTDLTDGPSPFGTQAPLSDYSDPTAVPLSDTAFTWSAAYRTTPFDDIIPGYSPPNPVDANQFPNLNLNET